MDNKKILTAAEEKHLKERADLITKSLMNMSDEQVIKLIGIAEGIMIANALNNKPN